MALTSTATRDARPSAATGVHDTAALRLAALVVFLLGWWLVAHAIGTSIIPGPAAVGRRMVHVVLHEQFVMNLVATLARVLIGLGISLVLAVVIGVAMGLNRNIERLFDGPMLGGRVMPGLAWALLALMVIGVSGRAPILAVVLSVFPLLTVQICEGTKALDAELFEMATVFRASRGSQLKEVVVPAILPSIAGGAKLGLALSWKVTVLAELFGVTNGVGFEINRNFQMFALDGVLAWALLFALVMALIEYGVIGPVYSRLTRWRSTGAPLSPAARMLRQAAWFRRVDDTRARAEEGR